MDEETIARAARVFADARMNDVRLSDIDEKYLPRYEADGYAIQDRLLDLYERRGLGRVAGYKVALVSEKMRESVGGTETLGLDTPVYGGISEKHLHMRSQICRFKSELGRL